MPLGAFSNAVVMRLTMEGADYTSEALNAFAPRAYGQNHGHMNSAAMYSRRSRRGWLNVS